MDAVTNLSFEQINGNLYVNWSPPSSPQMAGGLYLDMRNIASGESTIIPSTLSETRACIYTYPMPQVLYKFMIVTTGSLFYDNEDVAIGMSPFYYISVTTSGGFTITDGGGNPVPLQIIIQSVPDAPTNITVVPAPKSALVSWTTPHSNPALTGYKIYCTPDNKLPNTAGPTVTSLRVTGLKNGIPYKFAVVAINSLGSSYTAGCTPSTLPGVPKVKAIVGNGQATLSWVSKVAKGVPTTGYTITCNQAVTLPQAPTSPVVITGLTNGTSYIFSVRATNIIGTSAAGASKAVVPVGLPGVPNNVQVLGGVKSFQVNWAASTTGGLPIKEYDITYIGGGKTTVAKGKGVAPFTFMVTKLVTGTVYTVTMVAKNKVGVSAATSSVSVTVQ